MLQAKSKTVTVSGRDWYILVWKSRQGTRGRRYDLYSYSASENEKIDEGVGREIKGIGRINDAKKAIERESSKIAA